MYDAQHDQRLNSMMLRILKAEKENLKMPRSYSDMVEHIRKIIMDEAKRILGGMQRAN